MARTHFDEQLALLNTELLKMVGLVEQALEGSLRALENGDGQLATQIINTNAAINQKEREIESLCIKLLLQQQPIARDLRVISAALKMITDIKRIGNQAAEICQIVLLLLTGAGRTYTLLRVAHLVPLARNTIHMVNGAINAFVSRDVTQARKVIASDDEVDALYGIVKNEILAWLRSQDDAGSAALDLLLIAKYFERIGDHAQNIAEWVEYSITGKHKGVRLA